MIAFQNSFIRQLLKIIPSRFSSRTLHVPSRIAGFQQGWKQSGFQALGIGIDGVGNAMFCSWPEHPCQCRFSISCWSLLLCSVCMSSYQFQEGTLNQGSWWTEAVTCHFAFTFPYFILHVTTASNRDLGNVQETVNDLRLRNIQETTSEVYIFASRFSSCTLHGPSRTAGF